LHPEAIEETCRSLHDVRGVVGYAVALEQRGVFMGKPLFAMMYFLVADIVPDVSILEWRDAECSISVLPPEVPTVRERVMDPFRGCGLDAADQL
jgi:hypothetical protein